MYEVEEMEKQNIGTIGNLSIDDLNRISALFKHIANIEKQKSFDPISIKEFFEKYEIFINNTFSRKYLQSIQSTKKHLTSYFGSDMQLSLIGIREVEQFKVYMLKIAPKGINTYFRTIKAAFNVAVRWGYIEVNPFSRIALPKKQIVHPGLLSTCDLNKILEHIKNQVIINIFIFAYLTGCRLSECVNLQWGNVDMEKGLITIGDEKFHTKNRKQRVIPLNKKLKQMLMEMKRNGEYVFSKPSGYKYDKGYISRSFKEARKLAGIKDGTRFHHLRHSFGSNLANSGVPLVVIKELMGHQSLTTTEIYLHTNINEKIKAISQLN